MIAVVLQVQSTYTLTGKMQTGYAHIVGSTPTQSFGLIPFTYIHIDILVKKGSEKVWVVREKVLNNIGIKTQEVIPLPHKKALL